MAGLSVRFTDGTTTVTIDGSLIEGFAFQPPGAGAEFGEQSIAVMQSSASTARANVNSLNRLFEQAAQAKALGGVGTRIYAEVRPTTADSYYRTLVYGGSVTPSDDQFDVWYLNDYLKYTIRFQHAPWWEGAETQIAISNGNGTNNTSGLALNNHSYSTTASAYFTVAAGVIAGDAPVPVRIELTNATATALGYILIGLLRGTTAWDARAFIQAEAQTFGGTDTADAAASGGQYTATTVGAGNLFGVQTWSIPGTTVAVTEGKQVTPIMRLRAAPAATTYATLGVYADGGGIAATDYTEIPTGRQFVLFPPLPLPAGANGGPYAAHMMQMDTRNAGSSTTIDIDYIAFMPTDGLRQFVSTSDVLANTQTFYDDGIEERTYMSVSGNRQSSFVVYGEPFRLNPGQAATFVVLVSSVSGFPMTPANSVTARLYYRPRRFTL